MQSMMTNWKTTALGVGAILLALGHISTNMGSGSPIQMGDLMAIWTGVIGLFAKDGTTK